MYENDDPAWGALGAMNSKDAELTTLRQRLAEAEADLKQMSHHADAWKEAFDREWKRAEKAHADAARWEGAARKAEKRAGFDTQGQIGKSCVVIDCRNCGARHEVPREKFNAGVYDFPRPTASALVREGGGGTC